MSTALGLAMQISANTAQLAQAVQDVNAKLDAMGAAGKKASEDLGTLKNIEIAKLALGGIQAAGAAFLSLSKSVIGAAQDIVNFGKSVADELDNLNDVANRTGINVEALQAYGGAAKLAGSDVETFARSIQKLTVNIGKAVDDEDARKKFQELGLVFEELREKSPTEQFEAVADAVSRIADPAERAAAAVSVFGKTGIELGPLFSDGPGALAKMREEAVALGQVVSEDSIKSIAAMNDAFDKVWMTVRGLTGQIVGKLARPIAQIAEDLLKVVKEVGAGNIASTVAKNLLDFIQLAGNAFFTLAQFIEAFVKKFGPLLGIDVASNSEKQLGELVKQRDALFQQAKQAGASRLSGGDPARLKELGVQIDEMNTRIKALKAQVGAEAAGGALQSMQRNFNAAVNTAQARIDERAQAPAAAQPAVTTPEVAPEQSQADKELLDEVKGLRRDQQTGTVDILGAG